ncbi:hypothetical protein [Ancylomarina sp. 16SWW S1-10-2]|uniref:hypothetical protein n=1 Tax=Ancylomarina sp. 16SWW S1-10-2 TaxID=2499681 RepID=UPI0012AD3830|nr:hypothetical protein [Ancylomarina sp. 16SWW S1-10-2]MRT94143.1 hypothetical protein [Ancylomarina sp. 16SWW S1-10-2]
MELHKNVNADNFFIRNPLGGLKDKFPKVINVEQLKGFLNETYNTGYHVILKDSQFIVTVTRKYKIESYHKTFYLNPFETVSVYFASKNKYIGIEDHTVVMPGVLLAWILDQRERETNQILIDIGLTAASFYIGGTAVFKAAGITGKIINSILFVKGLTDKILESPEVLKILIKKKGDKGDELIQYYKDFSNLINCTLIFKNFADKEIDSKISLLITAWSEINKLNN